MRYAYSKGPFFAPQNGLKALTATSLPAKVIGSAERHNFSSLRKPPHR